MAQTPTHPQHAPAYYSPHLPAAAPVHVQQKSSALWTFIKGAAILGGGVALVSFLGAPDAAGQSLAEAAVENATEADANIFEKAIGKVGEGIQWSSDKINDVGFRAGIIENEGTSTAVVDTDKINERMAGFLPIAAAAGVGGLVNVAWDQFSSPSVQQTPAGTTGRNHTGPTTAA